MTVSVTSLFSVRTYAALLARGLQHATDALLPVTSWRSGDPTRTLYNYVAEVLSVHEDYTTESIKAGFLDDASKAWLKILAKQVFGVDAPEATYSTPTVTVTNSGGGYYYPGPGDLTFKSSASGATFHTTDGGTGPLTAGATVTYQLVSDDTGSDYTVAANEIDELVTTALGVVVVSSTASVALDAQEDEPLREQCRSTLGALSPNGPADAYEYVVRNHDLTGEQTIARALTIPNSSTGHVTVYVAGATGVVAAPAVAAAQTAIEQWATPLCISPVVIASPASPLDVGIAYTGVDIPAGFDALAEAAITALLGILPISPTVTRSALSACVQALAESGGATNVSVTVDLPETDTVFATGSVATPGTINVQESVT